MNDEFFLIAEANSLLELKRILPNLVIPKGERVRFVFDLNVPVAPAFDLAGAENSFRSLMPEGLSLIDVWGEGWYTAIIEAESDPITLAAIGAFLLKHWKLLSLLAIGITTVLGFLFLSISIFVTAVTAPEIISRTAMWVGIGLGSLAVISFVALAVRKRR